MNDSSEMRWQPGQMLLGKYRVDHVLGVGGMGAVIAATHVQLDQKVAMKFVHPEIAQHPEAVQRFIREARAAAQIRSEHVVRVSDVGALEDGSPYMVMEYLEGEDLEGALSRGIPATEVIVDYLLQACTGLLEAHQHGIVHRDLKPANLFLSKKRSGRVTVKVLDFGISKVQKPGDSALTQTSSLMGSPLYMSPEQMTRPKEVDHRADIWAMGVIAYEALTGQRPFNGDALPEICGQILALTPTAVNAHRPEIPQQLAAIVQKCLEKDPGARFQDVSELMEALEPFAPVSTGRSRVPSIPGESLRTLNAGTPPSSNNDQTTQQAWAETAGPGEQLPANVAARRSKTPLFVAAGAVVVLSVGGLLLLRGGEKEAEEPSTAALVPEPPKAAEPSPAAPPAAPTHEPAPVAAPAPTATPPAAPSTAAEAPKAPARTTTSKKPAAAAPEPAKPAATPAPAPAPAPVEAPKTPAKPKKANPLDIDIK